MKAWIISLLIGMSLSQFTFAYNSGEKKVPTRKAMDKALESLVNLFPYIYDQTKFTDGSNEEYINHQIKEISRAFKSVEHNKRVNLPGFQPSYQSIVEYLEATEDAFQSKNKYFARNRLQSLPSLCMSCHVQLQKQGSTKFATSLKKIRRDSFNDEYLYANFLFLLRDYTKSSRYLERYLSSFLRDLDRLKNNSQLKTVNYNRYMNALKQLLTISLQISYKPEKAIDYLDTFGKNKNLSPLIKEDIKSWRSQIVKLKKTYKPMTLKNDKDLLLYEKTNLLPIEGASLGDGSFDMLLGTAMGVLNRYMNYRPKSAELSRALYWTAVAERRLRYDFFYSLSELYLKECMILRPKHSYAKKCFKEYKDMINFGYTGSSGTDIPEDEQKELDALKLLISK